MGWQTDNFKDLGERGFVGCSNDRLLRSLEVATGSTGTLNDLWHKYWDTLFVPDGSFNDRMFYYLTTYASIDSSGLSSALNSERGIYIPAGEYFTELSAAGGMYYIIPNLSLDGTESFEIEVEIATTDTAIKNPLALFTDTAGEYFRLTYNFAGAPNVVKVETSGFTPGNGIAIINDGDLHTINIHYNGSTNLITLSVDGLVDYTTTHSSPSTLTRTFNVLIGAGKLTTSDSATNFLNGPIRNLRIWTGGDRTTGTLARFYPLNEATGTTIFDLSGNGQNGSTVNITDNERDLYRLNSDGNWLNIDNVTVIEVA